jgi:hypothetical protein
MINFEGKFKSKFHITLTFSLTHDYDGNCCEIRHQIGTITVAISSFSGLEEDHRVPDTSQSPSQCGVYQETTYNYGIS